MKALDIFLLGVFVITIVVHLIVASFQCHYQRSEADTTRLTVLATRTSLFLPLYALFLYISYVAPASYEAMAVPINLVEGFTFYTFMSLLVTNVGGSSEAVTYISNKEYFLCSCCFPSTDRTLYYRRVTWLMFHMLVTRPILSVIAAICSYSGSSVGMALFLLISVILVIIVLCSVVHLVNFYEMVFDRTTNLSGISKLFLLKFSVTLIVAQGLIANILVTTHTGPFSSDDGDDSYDETDKTIRGYSSLVLLELLALSLPYFLSYGYSRMTASKYFSDKDIKLIAPIESSLWFYLHVWSIWDVKGVLTLGKDSGCGNTNTLPLLNNQDFK